MDQHEITHEIGDRVKVLHNILLGNLIGTVTAIHYHTYEVTLDGGGKGSMYGFQLEKITNQNQMSHYTKITMKLSELIKLVGDEHISVQPLQPINVRMCKNDAEITFATEKGKAESYSGFNDPNYIAMVIWIPKERWPVKWHPPL